MWPWLNYLAYLHQIFCIWTMKKKSCFRAVLPYRNFWNDGNVLYLCCSAQYPGTWHLWPSRPWSLSTEPEKLFFTFYLISINRNLNSHRWPLAAILDSAALKHGFRDEIELIFIPEASGTEQCSIHLGIPTRGEILVSWARSLYPILI